MRSLPVTAVGYLSQVTRLDLPLLTAAEERDLLARAQSGSRHDATAAARAALHTVVLHNLPLVIYFARNYPLSFIELDDLIQEGNLGLIEAVTGYDLDYQIRFSSYARYHIKKRLAEFSRTTARRIRVPAWIYKAISRWRRAERQIGATLGHPSPLMVAELLQFNEKKARLVIQGRRVLSATGWADADHEFDTRLLDGGLSPAARLELKEDCQRLHEHLCELEPRQADLLTMRFGLYGSRRLTLREIGKRLGTTYDGARYVQTTALAALTERMAAG